MASRDEILKAAEEPAPIAPPRPARPSRPPPLPPEARSGELGEQARRTRTGSGPLEAVPSMIVHPGSSRVSAPMAHVLDLSSNLLPDSWMVDPNTDLLRGHRLRSIRNAAIALGAVILVGVAIFFAAVRTGDAGKRAATPPPVPDAAVQAAVDPPVDAQVGPTREDIVALSRFGFFSITATAKTQIYVDNNKIGETPLTRLPLPPGPHKIKAIGPHGKIKQINITIYGGRDTDEGAITW
jgi:hypothetical protein